MDRVPEHPACTPSLGESFLRTELPSAAAEAARSSLPPRTAPRRRRRSAFLAVAIVTALIAAVAVVTVLNPAAPTASAQPAFTYSSSWNMNGEMGGPGEAPGTGVARSESRWVADLQPELLRGANMIAVQEAGTHPPPRSRQTRSWANGAVTENYWDAGTDRVRHTNVYFADVGQQRNGLALVTHEAADEAVLLPMVNRPNARPVLGVRFGVIWYFTGHAPSGGAAADALIQTANQFMANRPGDERHRILADFNDNPSHLPLAYQRHIVRSNQPTHQGGGELDWAYYGDADQRTVQVDRQGLDSDHYMLRFFVLPGCGPRPMAARAEAAPASAPGEPDCTAPVPGEAYRIYSRYLDNAVIARDSPFGNGAPIVRHPTTGGNASEEVLYVHFSNEPGRYLLCFSPPVRAPFGGTPQSQCLTRGAEDSVNLWWMAPDNESQHWEFRQGHIHSPHLGAELQPSPEELGARMRVETRFYQWRWERYEPPRDADDGGEWDHGDLRKRDPLDVEESQPDEDDDTDADAGEQRPAAEPAPGP